MKKSDFEYLSNIKNFISQPEIKVSFTDDQAIEIAENKKRIRMYEDPHVSAKDKAPTFNANIDNENWNQTYTVILLNKVRPQTHAKILRQLPKSRVIVKAPKYKNILHSIEGSAKTAKNIVLITDEIKPFTSLDKLVEYKRLESKLKKYDRNIYLYEERTKLWYKRFPFTTSTTEPVTIDNVNLLKALNHYANPLSELVIKTTKFPSSDIVSNIPQAEQYYIKLKNNYHMYREVDYDITITYTEEAHQCKFCQWKKKCQYMQTEQVTTKLTKESSSIRWQKFLTWMTMVEQEEQRLIRHEESKLFVHDTPIEDIKDMMNILGFLPDIADETLLNHEARKWYKSIKEIELDPEDFIDYENLAKYDLNEQGEYDFYDYMVRRPIRLLADFFGLRSSYRIYKKLQDYKEFNNNNEYFGNQEYLGSLV